MSRPDGRNPDELRVLSIERGVNIHAEGSALVSVGNTKVLCTASVEENVPRWMRGQGKGWVTAEYGMLPRATSTRGGREAARGKQGGRTVEIQRLIGRSLRAVTHMKVLGERTVWLDCDVLQADGGTRCASITGAFVALGEALVGLREKGAFPEVPLYDSVAAISVGVVGGDPVLDLPYVEDKGADVDMNLVITGKGDLVEVQGTAEGAPFSRATLDELLALGEAGCAALTAAQHEVLPEIDWDRMDMWAR